MVIRPRCQRETFIAEHTIFQRIHGRIYRGFGVRGAVKRALRPGRAEPPRLGEPSAFRPGDWVRVVSEPHVEATLDAKKRTRGLLFAPQQGGYCGRIARVAHVVRRIVDDDGHFRPVSRTVLLEGMTCGGTDGVHGCGRMCPLLFRDEWLEKTDPPAHAEAMPGYEAHGWARVLPLAQIEATLDWQNRHGRVVFSPEMAQYAGQRFRVLRKVEHVFEADREAEVREPVFILDGPRCEGAGLGDDGPCDRGCALLWHADWLDLEEETATPPPVRLAPIAKPRACDLDAWKRAAKGAPAFLTPEFFRLVARHGKVGEPLVVLADEGGKAAALALRRDGRTLFALESDQTPRYDMVGDPEALPALWRALKEDESWDLLELEDVPAGSPLATRLLELAHADGFFATTHPGLRSPWFDLDEAWQSRLTSKFRANLRRCARNLGDPTLERIPRFDRAALDEGLAIEQASWKGDRGTAIACDAERRRFYAALLRSLSPRGAMEIHFLRARGKRIAFGIGIEDGSTHYELKIAFDPEFSAFSPGHLLVERVAEDARTRGLVRFDFLGWEQEWKRKWTDKMIDHVTPVVYRPNVHGRLLYSAREVLRPKLVDVKHAIEGSNGGGAANGAHP